MKRTLFESESTAARVRNGAAALLLALSAGCASNGGREAGVTSASKAVAVTTDTHASSKADADDSRRVRISADGIKAAEPSVAAAADGAVYVAWVGHGSGTEADVWLTRFDGAGQQAGEAARVNPEAGAATAWRGDPPDVVVAPDGTVYVAWTARAAGAEHATTLYLSASRDGGRSFAAPVKVNDDARACVHGMHSLAVDVDGRVYVAWLDERGLVPPEATKPGDQMGAMKASGGMHAEQNREVYFAVSGDGGRTFSQNRRVAKEACPCCKTALAVSADGRVYVGWRQVLPGDFRHIAVAASGDGGETFDAPTVVSDDRWELRGCPVSGPALKAGEGGAVRVLWYTAGEAGQPGLYSAESADGGHTFTPRRVVTEGTLRGTPLLLTDKGGRPFAVYEGMSESGSNVWRVRLGEAQSAAGGAALVSGGESAAASTLGGRLNVAYVAQGGVWLAQADGVD
ncbi:MAG: sialidase family protein [Pyrinomonadaceae bacterium]